MDPENSEDRLHKTYFITIVIGVAMIGSLFVYAGVVEYFKRSGESFGRYSGSRDVTILRYALISAALAEFFLIRIVSKLILAGKLTTDRADYRPVDQPWLIQRLSTAAIVVYALCESIGIFGLVLFLIGGSSLDFYIFFFMALASFIIYFPRYRAWEDWIKKEQEHPGHRPYS